MGRPTATQQALREHIENTRACASAADTAALEFLKSIVRYLADDNLQKGVALGLVTGLEDVRSALAKVGVYSKQSLVKLDEVIKEQGK